MTDLIDIFKNLKKHVMYGVSYMIPAVAAGGLIIGLGVLLGNNAGVPEPGTFAFFLFLLGKQGLNMMTLVIAVYVGFSIADKPAIAPGFIVGIIAQESGAGFLGGLVAGILNGIIVHYLMKIKFHKNLKALQTIIFVPAVTTVISGIIINYGVGSALVAFTEMLTGFFMNLDLTYLLLFCIIRGAVNQLDYGLFISKAWTPITAALLLQVDPVTGLPPQVALLLIASGGIAQAIPPLMCGISTLIAGSKKYTEEEKTAGISAIFMGMCGITEGAIPFALNDYFKVTVCSCLGGAMAAGLSIALGCESIVNWSGPIQIMGMTSIMQVLKYLFATAVAAGVAGVLLAMWKKPLADREEYVEVDAVVTEGDDGVTLSF